MAGIDNGRANIYTFVHKLNKNNEVTSEKEIWNLVLIVTFETPGSVDEFHHYEHSDG